MSDRASAAGQNIAWLATCQARRAAERPGATPELLADITAATEILAEIGSPPSPPADSDTAARLARLSDHNALLARLAEVMTRIEADNPESAEYWRVIVGGHNDIAAQLQHAALLAADAEVS
jgi:hypothetical protein